MAEDQTLLIDGLRPSDWERFRGVHVFISDYTAQKGYSPTVREIKEMCGFRSTSTVHSVLDRMKKRGLVDWTSGSARTLRTLGEAPEAASQS